MFKAQVSKSIYLAMMKLWPGDQGVFTETWGKIEDISVLTKDSQCNVPGLSHDVACLQASLVYKTAGTLVPRSGFENKNTL